MEALNLERGRREERAEGDGDAAKTKTQVWVSQFLNTSVLSKHLIIKT